VVSLACRGEKAQLAVPPHIEPEDVKAWQIACDNRVQALHSIPARYLASIEDAPIKERLSTLAWLSEADYWRSSWLFALTKRVTSSEGFAKKRQGFLPIVPVTMSRLLVDPTKLLAG
jgi:hypothetical protein